MLCGGVAACHRYGVCSVFNKKGISWCMNFIDIKMHGTTIKTLLWCFLYAGRMRTELRVGVLTIYKLLLIYMLCVCWSGY